MLNKEEALKLVLKSLQGPAGKELAQRVDQKARIEIRRGQSINLFLRNQRTPALSIKTQDDGRIRVDISPDPDERSNRLRYFKPESLIISPPERTRENWLVFWDTIHQTAQEQASSWLEEHHPDCTESHEYQARPQAAFLAQRVVEQVLQQSRNSQLDIMNRLDQTLAGMTCPATRKLAAQNGKNVNLHRYNLARMGPENLRKMKDEYPGTLCWAMWRQGGKDAQWRREQGFQEITSPQDARRQFLAYLEHRGLDEAEAHTGERIRLTPMRKMLRTDQKNGGLARTIKTIHHELQEIKEKDLDPQAVQEAAKRIREHPPHTMNESQAQDELLHLADPQAHRTARRQGSPATPQGMLIARMGPENLRSLERTNPGALSWANLRLQPGETIQHPGQLIRMVRQQTEQEGFDSQTWRTMTATSRPLMRAICLAGTRPIPGREALIISAIHQAQARPGKGIAQMLTTQYMPEQQTPQNQRAIMLIIRESARQMEKDPQDQQQRNLQMQFTLVKDYCQGMAQDDQPVNSRTWAGIRKKSNDWHQEMSIRKAQELWKKTLARQENAYPAWNSCIPTPRQDGEFTITHLGSQKELFQESGEMLHCVHSYTKQCRTSNSRIFSIMKKEKHIATGEIRLREGTWRSAQVRGRHNNGVKPHLESVMERLARDYTQSWQRGARHRDWNETSTEEKEQ